VGTVQKAMDTTNATAITQNPALWDTRRLPCVTVVVLGTEMDAVWLTNQ
jgi:hypothetical protein